jgi:UDP-glucose 4-epimerase
MRCLLLGAGGYLGQHLRAALRLQGHELSLPDPGPDGSSVRLDLAEPDSLAGIDWQVDCIYMLAGVTGTGVSFPDHRRFVHGNELSLLNVLEAVRSSPHRPRLVFPSSRLVYRGADRPLTEEASLEARTVYAANKIACEFYLRAYAQAHEVPYTILRIGVPYGNTCSADYSFGTVGSFIRQATTQRKISLYGGGAVRRSFSHVADICTALVAAGGHGALANGLFNMPGEDFSLHEVALLIAQRAGAVVETRPWPDADWRIESGSTVFDGSKLLAELPDLLRHSLAEWALGLQLDGQPQP